MAGLFPGLVFLVFAPICLPNPVPAGTFQTECHERHFWLSIQASFLGTMVRFDFEDQDGFHILSDQEATDCGYTMLLDRNGDLVFRASFLACHVHSKGDTDYHLRVWFVNRQADGTVAVYPFQLRCTLTWPWGTREMVCEENYMESAGVAKMVVMFHTAGQLAPQTKAWSVVEATTLGYHISERDSRLILRCSYSSPHSFIAMEEGVDVEVVRATIIYPVHGSLLAIDTTVACMLNEATVDGSSLVWRVPRVLSSLVRAGFRDRGMRVGVASEVLSERDLKERRYQIDLKEGLVEVRIPLGARGGHIKSGVVHGQYSQSMSVDLFFMRQWEDQHWPLTQHRSFRLLQTPLVPRRLAVINNTVPSEGHFSVTLGVFPPDVALQMVSVGEWGDPFIWTHMQNQSSGELRVSKVPHPNGTYSYQISVPFSNSHVTQEYLGVGYRKYSLPLTFGLTILPNGGVFYHRATVESYVREQTALASPRLEGRCTTRGVLVMLHYGDRGEMQWELFLGSRRLDWELVEMGDFRLEAEEDYFSVEIPLYSPGMTYEELTLRGLVAKVEISVMDVDSLKVEGRLVQRCTFSVRELLVCLPEGRMVAVVDTTHTIPATQPNRTTLLDPSCGPLETDSARALFNFSLASCGTTVTSEGNFLVYENQVIYQQDYLHSDDQLIHRDSPYRWGKMQHKKHKHRGIRVA
ncbi:uncharacterized protein LOC130130490 [Lampris incognitus]|uniref:uncharacterized protein LOC130130490 n=1 Tax=Lampris incognitus TaxID=2546036 RepID=UPI0024B62E4B|nr:uncharacterized protein LOC130130490 [Lampris incognitus]